MSGIVATQPTSSVSLSPSSIIYVPDSYAKIQWAVDNASNGSMVVVRNETYTENIGINRSSADSVSPSSKDYNNINCFNPKNPGQNSFPVLT